MSWKGRAHFAAISHGQAGLLHKHTKNDQAPATSSLQAAGSQPLAACADKLAIWKQIWRADELQMQALSPWMHGPESDAALPPADSAQVRDAALSFPALSAICADRMHPRVFANVADATRGAVADVLEKAEACLAWPSQVELLICALIPRGGGGDRPIFVMPSIIRLWEKTRLPLMKDWAVGMRRSYDWSGEGRSSQEAVWWQLLRAEGLEDNDGPEAEGLVTVLLDVVKCFDRVGLRHVWRWGTQQRMPPRLLRMILVTYALARRIAHLGSLSDPTSTRTAVVPGSAFAIFVLHAVLVTPCDDLLRAHQRHGLHANLRIAKYVDDIAISVQGKCSDVQEIAISAFDWMECRLRLDLGLEVSLADGVGQSAREGKSVVIASSEWLRAKMASRSRARGLRVVATARNLGIQQRGFGVNKSTDVREARMRAVEAPRTRLSYAGKSGASVHRGANLGLKPAATYGQRALGLHPRQRLRLRRMVNASLPGTHFGRSLRLRLAISDAETLHESRADPINAWAAATWEEQGELVMAAAWLRQNVAAAANGAWKRVVGLASTIVAMIKEIQWTWPAWHTFRSREGLMMDMRATCPRDVTAMAIKDSKRVALEAWVAADPGRAELHPCAAHRASGPLVPRAQGHRQRGGGRAGCLGRTLDASAGARSWLSRPSVLHVLPQHWCGGNWYRQAPPL